MYYQPMNYYEWIDTKKDYNSLSLRSYKVRYNKHFEKFENDEGIILTEKADNIIEYLIKLKTRDRCRRSCVAGFIVFLFETNVDLWRIIYNKIHEWKKNPLPSCDLDFRTKYNHTLRNL